MSTERDALERVLGEILESLGVRSVGRDRKVIIDPARDGYRIRLAVPTFYVDVPFDRLEMAGTSGPMLLFDKISRSARILFASVIDHIAKHDRSPIDRVKDIEDAATALLDAMRIHLDDIRMPHGSSSAVLNAAYRLREILQAKPGAAAWKRDGYGEDPPEVKAAP